MNDMRTLIILILMSVFISQTQAQQLRLSNTENLDFFVGTWKYESDQISETFTLRLRKVRDTVHTTIIEGVAGAYTHWGMGRRGLDCMDQFFSTSTSPSSMPVYATNASRNKSNVNPDKLRLRVTDYGLRAPNGDLKRVYNCELSIVSKDSIEQIRWILKDDLGGLMLEEEAPSPGFSIPADIILTKIADE